MNASVGGGLNPWVEIMPNEPEEALQARVQQHGEDYLKSWSDRLSAPGAETALEFLCTGAPHQAIARVHGMTAALATFLENCFQKDRLPALHLLIRICARDGHEVATSPLMLATTAVVYSQTDWNRRRFHDLRSASRTEDLLDRLDYPSELIRTVALLVGLKNVVRTSVGDDKEVGVWVSNQLSFDDGEISKSFAALLQDRFPASASPFVSPEAVADSLVLVTAAYEAHSKPATRALLQDFEDFGASLKKAIRLRGFKCGTLVSVEFSKFPFPSFATQRARFMKTVAKKYLGSTAGQAPFIVWVSLDRYWSTMHPTALLASSPTLAAQFQPWLEPRPRCFVGLLGTRSAALYKLVLQGDDAFEMIIGRRPPPGATIWERVDITLGNFRISRGQNSRIPTAFLARQLQILGFCYPDEMFELRVQGDERSEGLSAYSSLWLPTDPKNLPTIQELETLIKCNDFSNPKLLVTRYAASMVMNRSIGFGYPARVFESVAAGTPVAKWIELIQWVADKNAHGEWFKYLGKYRAAPPYEPYYILQRIQVAAVANPLVLGVDIGGTSTKVALYAYDPVTGALSAPCCEHKFATKNPVDSLHEQYGGQQYDGASAFVRRLDDELATAWPQWSTYREHLVAIGLTWPGAVAGRPGLEYVAANSTALTYFKPYPSKNHWEADAADIRRLRLREAFAIRFQHGGSSPYVRLINDAVAHVFFERWQLAQFAPRPGEIVVGLTAGTGSGMAVLEAVTGRLLDILAEVGRLITHVSDPFPPPGAPPVGQGRDAFNNTTLGAVATKLLKQELTDPQTARRFLKRKLDADPAVASQILNQALGAPASTGAAGLLPQVPSLLIGWLIEESYAAAPVSVTEQEFEAMWDAENPAGTCKLRALRDALRDFLKALGCPNWPGELAFAKDVVKRAGWELADLIATTAGLFGATNVITGGGPLSGFVGQELRASARRALIEDYKYEVPDSTAQPGVKAHRLARLIRLPEPHGSAALRSRPVGPSGPYGAAASAVELLRK